VPESTGFLQIGNIHQPYTHLVPALKGVDPDDAFSIVPYEKGSNLLMYLEQKLGGAGQHCTVLLLSVLIVRGNFRSSEVFAFVC